MPIETINIPRDTTMQEIARATETIAAILATGETGVENWGKAIQLIRLGLGPKIFPKGISVNVPHTDYGSGNIVLQVMGNDIIPDPTGVREHTLTLMMRDVIYPRIFSDRELLWANNGTDPLPAGTYSFTLVKGAFDSSTSQDGPYKFTMAQAIPKGGGWRHSSIGAYQYSYSKAQVLAGTITTYDASGNVIEENIAVTEGSDGTNLGTASRNYIDTAAVIGAFNSTERNAFGSGNYGESALRLWLNSNQAGGSWFVKPTIFSMLRKTDHYNAAGFLKNIDLAFSEALIPVDIVTARNTYFEIGGTMGGSYTIRDKVFIPSLMEIGLGASGAIEEGTMFPFFDGATAVDRIKYDIGDPSPAREYFLRSINMSRNSSLRTIKTNGANLVEDACNGRGVAAVFTIG